MANSSMAIANEFIKRAGPFGLTQMQLQKLTYIAHGWCLALTGAPLVSDRVEAWDYGPVFPKLYDHAKYFGRESIHRLISADDNNKYVFFSDSEGPGNPYCAVLSDDEKKIIDLVWARYGRLSAFRLSEMTHQPGTPCYTTYNGIGRGATMTPERIKTHYLNLAGNAQPAA